MGEIFGFEIKTKSGFRFSVKLSCGGEPEEMSAEELREYRAQLEQSLAELEESEPEDSESEEYDDWQARHLELEILLDDVNSRLEEPEEEEAAGGALRLLGFFLGAVGLAGIVHGVLRRRSDGSGW